jgi:sec-independent protein translocase protein TatC
LSSETLMSLREHLSELKHRFKVAFTSFVVILAVLLVVPENPSALISGGYNSFRPLIGFFIDSVDQQLLPAGWTLIASGGLSQPLEIYLVASVLFALVFNAPIFAYEVINFISPALNEREKRLVYPFVGASTGLFAFGVVFGYFFLAKFLLVALSPFFITTHIAPLVDAGSFYFTVFLTIAMAGFAFTIPVYVYTLIDFGIVQASSIRKNRLIIWAVTYIATAVITPDGGPILDLILFIPIITLLEVAVFLGGRSRANALKKQEREKGESPGPGPASPDSPSPAIASLPAPVSVPAPTPASQRVCAYCKNYLAPGVVFCPNCGRSND